MGKQAQSAIGAFLISWILGVPLSYYLGNMREMGVVGIATGFEISLVCQTIFNLYIVHYSQDWQDVADEAADRIAKESQERQTAETKR